MFAVKKVEQGLDFPINGLERCFAKELETPSAVF